MPCFTRRSRDPSVALAPLKFIHGHNCEVKRSVASVKPVTSSCTQFALLYAHAWLIKRIAQTRLAFSGETGSVLFGEIIRRLCHELMNHRRNTWLRSGITRTRKAATNKQRKSGVVTSVLPYRVCSLTGKFYRQKRSVAPIGDTDCGCNACRANNLERLRRRQSRSKNKRANETGITNFCSLANTKILMFFQ